MARQRTPAFIGNVGTRMRRQVNSPCRLDGPLKNGFLLFDLSQNLFLLTKDEPIIRAQKPPPSYRQRILRVGDQINTRLHLVHVADEIDPATDKNNGGNSP